MTRHPYFAYGSNLEPVQMRRRCPDHTVIGRAVLPDHELVFPRPADDWGDAGVAGVLPRAGSIVHGVVFEVSDQDLMHLDAYEGIETGDYTREHVDIQLESGEVLSVLTYYAVVMPPGHFTPWVQYMTAIIDGATHHGLPADWIAMLRKIETRPTAT